MALDEIISVWVGGPLDGMEQHVSRSETERELGGEIICGGVELRHSAIYRFDDNFTDNRIYLRFVRLVTDHKKA